MHNVVTYQCTRKESSFNNSEKETNTKCPKETTLSRQQCVLATTERNTRTLLQVPSQWTEPPKLSCTKVGTWKVFQNSLETCFFAIILSEMSWVQTSEWNFTMELASRYSLCIEQTISMQTVSLPSANLLQNHVSEPLWERHVSNSSGPIHKI